MVDGHGDPNSAPAGRAAAITAFSAAAEQVLAAHPEDEQGRMLQSVALKTAGKFYAFATPDDVVVKLPAKRVAALIDAGSGLACSPRPGRPMREWVRLPDLDDTTCLAYVLEARAFVTDGASRGR